jgi:release factor glutamine methyltransferase
MTEPSHTADTVGSVVRQAAAELKTAAIESPDLTAQLLLGYAMGWDRVRVLSHPEVALSTRQASTFASLIRRRVAGEPLQYITGTQEFYGLPFQVTPAVLIPRPETEILVEKVIGLAHSEKRPAMCFADVGTGSGCIAVSIACSLPEARGFAFDISAEALMIARANAKRHNVANRIHFVRSDLIECTPAMPVFDVVASNPPYVAADAQNLHSQVRDHEPQLALFGGTSGLEIYRRLIPSAAARLNRGGRLVFEIGAGMEADLVQLVVAAGLSVEAVADDLQAIPRCIIARRGNG